MSEIQPPPKIEHPPVGEFIGLRDGIRLMTDQMEALAAWMYETAQWMERKANEDRSGE